MKELFIITGANGHLGNTVARKLVSQGKWVRGLVLPEDKLESLDGVDIELIRGNVCDKESLEPLFQTGEPCDIVVIHAAGIVSIASKFHQIVHDVNVTGTKNVVDICKKYQVKKLVHVSSVHAIPERPAGELISESDSFDEEKVVGLYAKTKAEATRYVLESAREGLNAVVVHPSGIIGPNDYGHGHITQLVMDYLDGRLTSGIIGGYDFVDVRDVADGILSAIEKGGKGECYILSGSFYTVKQLLTILHEISGKRRIRSFLPAWFVNLTVPLAEAYYKLLKQPPLFTHYSIYTLRSNANFSNAKAKRALGYTSRDIRETLTDTIRFLRENHRVKV